jgi:hypothetical protein
LRFCEDEARQVSEGFVTAALLAAQALLAELKGWSLQPPCPWTWCFNGVSPWFDATLPWLAMGP